MEPIITSLFTMTAIYSLCIHIQLLLTRIELTRLRTTLFERGIPN